MKKLKITSVLMLSIILVSMILISCKENTTENGLESHTTEISVLEKEIELRLREYETLLKNGDSIALGNMYTLDAEIIPSTIGRDNIVKVFASMIRDSVTGSFKTTNLWGNDQLVVEQGNGHWYSGDGIDVGSGNYLLVWKKEDGEWKILRDTWFPDN
jgi:ketosteroid isomerase-like protein